MLPIVGTGEEIINMPTGANGIDNENSINDITRFLNEF